MKQVGIDSLMKSMSYTVLIHEHPDLVFEKGKIFKGDGKKRVCMFKTSVM